MNCPQFTAIRYLPPTVSGDYVEVDIVADAGKYTVLVKRSEFRDWSTFSTIVEERTPIKMIPPGSSGLGNAKMSLRDIQALWEKEMDRQSFDTDHKN